MATKDILKAREENCRSTEDYVNLSKEVFKAFGDKKWASSLIEDGADWAETVDDFLHLASGAAEVLKDKTTASVTNQIIQPENGVMCLNPSLVWVRCNTNNFCLNHHLSQPPVTHANKPCIVTDFLK